MTQLTAIDTNNFAAMSKAMGYAVEADKKTSSNTLPRLRINHSAIMGLADVNGKKVNMEVVEGGTYKLEIPDGPTYYAPAIKMRVYLQRFMYKRFVKGSDKTPNKFIKTLMHDNLNDDLKDNEGGFNCGKPAGFIKDWKALPEKMQNLIKEIKRVRAILGTVELINPVNEKGEPVELGISPFIWEIDNRDAFKVVGEAITKIVKLKLLPVRHIIDAVSEERKLPNGASYYVPVVKADVHNQLPMSEVENETFTDFMSWVENYNTYIANTWAEKAKEEMDEEDVDIVDSLIDIEIDEEEVA